MDPNNHLHAGAFATVAGLLVYAVVEIGAALFIVELPLADDWCREWVEREVAWDEYSEVCVEHKNAFEASKEWFNAEQRGRYKWLFGFALALGAGLGYCAFYLAPKVRGTKEGRGGAQEALITGAFLSGLVAIALGLFFPGPDTWLPNEIERFRSDQVEYEMMILRDLE